MKALLCTQWGPPESLVVDEVERPKVGPGQVLIRVRAAGVNFPDTLIIQNRYQFKPALPFSPGGECAGVVEALGANAHRFQRGDRVIAFTAWGAFAEYVSADVDSLIAIPDGLDDVTASALAMTYGTAYHALADRAALKPGETILVLGASGGVGLASVEVAKALGARVIAAASSAAKLAVCREHGAD
jgi:NADPH2:quinone reductase